MHTSGVTFRNAVSRSEPSAEKNGNVSEKMVILVRAEVEGRYQLGFLHLLGT